MKTYEYKIHGTCASAVRFTIEDGKLHNVSFTGGCNGNLKAISKLVEGEDARKISELLRGNTCGFKSTSCVDQLSSSIAKALEENEDI